MRYDYIYMYMYMSLGAKRLNIDISRRVADGEVGEGEVELPR